MPTLPRPTTLAMPNSSRIAQIVALKIAQPAPAAQDAEAPASVPQSLHDVFGDPNNFPAYTVKVFDAKRGGDPLYAGTICPIYAKLVNDPAVPNEDEWKVLGIRTIDPKNDKFAETVGAGASYYKNLTGDIPIVFQSAETTKDGEPKAEVQAADTTHGQRLVVTYEQVDAAAISGAVKYVDVDGNIIETEIVENLGEGKEVAIKKSFFKTTTDEAGQETTHYYRVIQRLTGSTIMLTPEQATKQIRVMEVKNTEAGAYQVTINYVDDNGNTLWTDSVDVKGKGYQYTLPNSFSMSAVTNAADAPTTDRDKGQWGVNYYTLDSWTIETNATDDNVAIGARSAETQQGNPVVAFEAGEYPAGRTVTAKYVSQATTKKVNLTVMEINGETGALIDKIHYEVTPEQTATYTPAPKNGLVPWSGNMEPITYAWEDLEKGTDVLQYVYYVPEDYTPGDTYDITVQYMNIANSQILRSETITIDPETNDFVNILGEEQFALGDDTYVRLAGQETAIRHAYFSPARTYTIYYRDVNDELSAQITIRRTQIVDTERVVTVPGTTVMTAAPVAAAPLRKEPLPMLRRRQRLMPVWAQAMPPRSSTTMTIRWRRLAARTPVLSALSSTTRTRCTPASPRTWRPPARACAGRSHGRYRSRGRRPWHLLVDASPQKERANRNRFDERLKGGGRHDQVAAEQIDHQILGNRPVDPTDRRPCPPDQHRLRLQGRRPSRHGHGRIRRRYGRSGRRRRCGKC